MIKDDMTEVEAEAARTLSSSPSTGSEEGKATQQFDWYKQWCVPCWFHLWRSVGRAAG